MAGQDVDHLSVQKFGLPVVLTGHVNKWPEKKMLFQTITFQEHKQLFSLMLLLVRLVSSSCYRVIFNNLNGQNMPELKFLLSGNTKTGKESCFFAGAIVIQYSVDT